MSASESATGGLWHARTHGVLPDAHRPVQRRERDAKQDQQLCRQNVRIGIDAPKWDHALITVEMRSRNETRSRGTNDQQGLTWGFAAFPQVTAGLDRSPLRVGCEHARQLNPGDQDPPPPTTAEEHRSGSKRGSTDRPRSLRVRCLITQQRPKRAEWLNLSHAAPLVSHVSGSPTPGHPLSALDTP